MGNPCPSPLEWEGAGSCQDAPFGGLCWSPSWTPEPGRTEAIGSRNVLSGRQSKAIQVLAMMPCLRHTDGLQKCPGKAPEAPCSLRPLSFPSVTAHHPFSHLLFNPTSPKGKLEFLTELLKKFQVRRYWSDPENVLGSVVREPLLERPHTDLS